MQDTDYEISAESLPEQIALISECLSLIRVFCAIRVRLFFALRGMKGS